MEFCSSLVVYVDLSVELCACLVVYSDCWSNSFRV